MYLPFVNRHQSKLIAVTLLIAGVLLAPDIIAPTPLMDVLLNVPLAMIIADLMSITYLEAFMVTYLISGLLILAGLLIYPYNTMRLINGKAKFAFRWIVTHPLMFAAAIVIFLIIYFSGSMFYDMFYQDVKTHALTVLQNVGLM